MLATEEIAELRLTHANAKALNIGDEVDFGASDGIIGISLDHLATSPDFETLTSLFLHEIGHLLGVTSESENITVEFGRDILDNYNTSRFDLVSRDNLSFVEEQRHNFTPFDFFRYADNAILASRLEGENGSQTNADFRYTARSLFPEVNLDDRGYFSLDGGKRSWGDLESGTFLNAIAKDLYLDEDLNDGELYNSLLNSYDIFQGPHFLNSVESSYGASYGIEDLDSIGLFRLDLDVP